jgi:hypothetical protein
MIIRQFFVLSYNFNSPKYLQKHFFLVLWSSAAKPDLFFWAQPDFRFKRVGGLSGSKNGSNRVVGWPQKGFKFGFNPKMYLIHPIWTQTSGFKIGLALRVKIQVKFGLGWLGSFGRTTLKHAILAKYDFSFTLISLTKG